MMTSSNTKNTILFVDDDESCHFLVDLMISDSDEFELLKAFNGQDAISLAKKYRNRICLVLADIMLPDISGYELLKMFVHDNSLRKVPFLFQSGLPHEEAQQYASYDNVNIILKPYKKEELLSSIHKLI